MAGLLSLRMKRQQGIALIGVLLILSSLAVLVAALVYVTLYLNKSTYALNQHKQLKQAAYSALNQNQQYILSNPYRVLNVGAQCPLGACNTETLTWHDMPKVKGSHLTRLRYAAEFANYLPMGQSLFESRGSYVYLLFSQASYHKDSRGILYEESYWLPMVPDFQSYMLNWSMPEIARPEMPLFDPLQVNDEERKIWAKIPSQIKKEWYLVLDKSKTLKLWRKNERQRRVNVVQQQCQDHCWSAEGWVLHGDKAYWQYAVASNKRILIWEIVPNDLQNISEPSVKIDLNNEALLGSPKFVRTGHGNYLVGVTQTKHDVFLNVWNVINGDLIQKIPLTAGMLKKNAAQLNNGSENLIDVLDMDNNLKADDLVIYLGNDHQFFWIKLNEESVDYWEPSVSKHLLDSSFSIKGYQIVKRNEDGQYFLVVWSAKQLKVYTFRDQLDGLKLLWSQLLQEDIYQLQFDVGQVWVLEKGGRLKALWLNSGEDAYQLQLSKKVQSFALITDLYRKKRFIVTHDDKIAIPENGLGGFLRENFRQYEGKL